MAEVGGNVPDLGMSPQNDVNSTGVDRKQKILIICSFIYLFICFEGGSKHRAKTYSFGKSVVRLPH